MRGLLKDTRGQGAGMIGVVVALLVAIAVGVMIWYKLNAAIYSATYVAGKNMAALNTTWSSVNTTSNTIWTLFPIVGIIVIAGIILGIVSGFGRGPAT